MAIAYLCGGPERALMAALGSMRLAGTIVAQGHDVCGVRAEGRLDLNANELERAIHHTAATPIRWDYLDAEPTVSTELEQLRRWLEEAGLLLSTERQRRIKHTGWWMVAVAVLGLPVAGVAGVASGAVAGLLILALLAAGILLDSAPRLSRRGTARMQALCARHVALAPQMRPDWRSYLLAAVIRRPASSPRRSCQPMGTVPSPSGQGSEMTGPSASWAGVDMMPHDSQRAISSVVIKQQKRITTPTSRSQRVGRPTAAGPLTGLGKGGLLVAGSLEFEEVRVAGQ